MGAMFLVPIGALFFASAALGQSLLNPERANNVTSLLGNKFDPWENPGTGTHAPYSAGDPDLGEQRILSPLDDYRPFNFQLAQRSMWTDNAALTDGDELDDFYSNTELRLAYLPQLAANTYGQVSASYSFYRYADNSSLDFDSLEASVGAIHVFRDLNDLSVWLRYNHTRLLSGRGHDEIFTDHSIELGFYLPIELGPRHSAFASYTSEFSIDANPGFAQRNEHTATIGYQFAATDRIKFETYYQLSVHDFEERGRDDLLNTAGIAVTTRLTDTIDLVLAGSYAVNDSDLSGGDYEVGNVGLVASLRFEF